MNPITGAVVEAVLDPLFSPLLSLPPWLAIGAIALLVSVIVTVIYKLTTDQNLMRSLKQEMKDLQKEMKDLRSHPEKMAGVQARFMQTNMKYMMGSMKSTLFTILPIIFIFGWLNANLAFEPLAPGQQFTVTADFAKGASGTATLTTLPEGITQGEAVQQIVDSKATWLLQGAEGEYVLEVAYGESSAQVEVLITSGRGYRTPVVRSKSPGVRQVTLGNEKMEAFRVGSFSVGWFWTYIIFAITFSIALRRVMKVA